MLVSSGFRQKDDVYIELSLDHQGLAIELVSSVEKLFGPQIEKVVRDTLVQMHVENVFLKIEDFGALDFVIRARLKTAIKRALAAEGTKNV